jgi:hypothetical protein
VIISWGIFRRKTRDRMSLGECYKYTCYARRHQWRIIPSGICQGRWVLPLCLECTKVRTLALARAAGKKALSIIAKTWQDNIRSTDPDLQPWKPLMAKRVEGMFSCMEDPIDMPAICWIRQGKQAHAFPRPSIARFKVKSPVSIGKPLDRDRHACAWMVMQGRLVL